MRIFSRRGSARKYAYITARVRSMKRKLIPKETYPKLLQMDIPEIIRFIEESEYRQDVDELARSFSGIDLLEHALNRNLAMTYRKLIDISQEEAKFLITEYLRYWDIWNIKTILRGKYYGASEEEILDSVVSAGELRYRDLTSLVKIESIEEIIAELSNTPYYEILKNYDGGVLSNIEDELDKLYYLRLLKSVGESQGDKLFLKFIRTEIDIKNLQNLFRLKKAEADKDIILNKLIPGGMELKQNDLNKLSSLSLQEFIKALESLPYWNAIADIVSQESIPVGKIATRLNKYALDYVSQISHYYPLSIVPILDYMISKKNEVTNIRIIARGKETNLPDNIIRDQLVI
ncbi:MAG: V-type ATP synthase subunit C [Methanosarcinales archaeon]